MNRFFRTICHNLLVQGCVTGYITCLIGKVIPEINSIHGPVKDRIRVEPKFGTPYPVPSGKANWRLKTASKISDEANLQSVNPISLQLKNVTIHSIHV